MVYSSCQYHEVTSVAHIWGLTWHFYVGVKLWVYIVWCAVIWELCLLLHTSQSLLWKSRNIYRKDLVWRTLIHNTDKNKLATTMNYVLCVKLFFFFIKNTLIHWITFVHNGNFHYRRKHVYFRISSHYQFGNGLHHMSWFLHMKDL